MNVIGGMAFRWLGGGLVLIGLGLLLVGVGGGIVWSLGLTVAMIGAALAFTSWRPLCARCYSALWETSLLFPIEQLDALRRDLWTGTADALGRPSPVDLVSDRIALVRGKFCPGCGAVALVALGELYPTSRFEVAPEPAEDEQLIEVTGLAALAIRRLALTDQGSVN